MKKLLLVAVLIVILSAGMFTQNYDSRTVIEESESAEDIIELVAGHIKFIITRMGLYSKWATSKRGLGAAAC